MKRLDVKNQLALADFAGDSRQKIRESIAGNFEVPISDLDRFQILIAYMSVGNFGCDSSAWFLLRDRTSGEYFEVHASHCSCYGFEGQWSPEPTALEYLKSDNFSFWCGGYDGNEPGNKQAAKDYIAKL